MALRNKIYYGIKPLVPLSIRRTVRRWFALRTRRDHRRVWPILPGSERRPEDWSGWPDGKKFAFVLTHDVEGRSGLGKCRQLMELEMERGFRSSFNFVPEGEYQVSPELCAELVRNGFEVGVHDLRHDGRLYGKREEFAANAAKINGYLKKWGAVGFRAGFMLHNLEWCHDLDILYDASTFDVDPFEPEPVGMGTIFPFWKQGPGQKGYVELPYTLPQDSTLFLLFGEKTPEIWMRKLDWVAQHGGMVLVNVHPDYIGFDDAKRKSGTYPVAIYEQLLRYVEERYAGQYWHALPKQLAEWHGRRGAQVVPGLLEKNELANPAGRNSGERPRMATVLYSYYLTDPRPRRETETLAGVGLEPDVTSLRNNAADPLSEKVAGVNIDRIPLRRQRAGKLTYVYQYGSFFLQTFWRLSFRSLTRRYCLVHVHNMPDFLVFAALVPKLLGAKILLDLHDPMPELYCSIYGKSEQASSVRLLRVIERWSIAFADQVITPNLAFKDVFSQRTGNGDKIEIVMNSPETSVFHPEKAESRPAPAGGKRPFRIMYHGLLVERHGLDLAIEALAQLRGDLPDIILDLYGEKTPYVDLILRQIDDLKLQDMVVYHGYKSQKEIARAIRDIDLGLIPNRLNRFTAINFPTRIFEYLAIGKPLLVPRTKGIQDYFDEDEILYFEPENVADLAKKIQWACLHPAELAEITKKGRVVYEEHQWNVEQEKLIQVVQNLLKDTKSGPLLRAPVKTAAAKLPDEVAVEPSARQSSPVHAR